MRAISKILSHALLAFFGVACWYHYQYHSSIKDLPRSLPETEPKHTGVMMIESDHSSRSLRAPLPLLDPKTIDLKSVEAIKKSSVSIVVPNEVGFHVPMPSGTWLLDKDKQKSLASPNCCDRANWHRSEVPAPECKANIANMGGFLPSGKGGNGCNCGNFQEEYTWSGISSPWDANDACRLLNGRRVLMIGDSTMAQAGSTLLNALYPGGCHNQFRYVIADTLVHEKMGAYNRGKHWLEYVKEHSPDIILMTAGAHIYKKENFDRVLTAVIEGTSELKQSNPNLQVVWKTQQPGGCTPDILTPSDNIPQIWDRYNYDEFYARDMHALSVLPQHGIHVLDMRMLYYRSDAHIDSKEEEQRDCLHMCQPGPLDVIADLFWKLLQSLEGSDGVVSGKGLLVQ